MPALLAPPPVPPRSRPAAPSPAGLSPAAFHGRTLAEYARCFALDPAALRGRDVLDVAAGPSSFVAEACARRINAVAVDPLYGGTPDELAGHVQLDHERLIAQLRARPRRFRGRSFSSLAAAEEERQLAAQRFLADYATAFARGRYVSGALPRLPFFDGTFDVVLCAHLCFTDLARFDFDWHIAAARELVRVSAGEVRIHPLCDAEERAYPGLARLRRELRTADIASEIVAVEDEFCAGGNAMLVLRRRVES